MNLFLHKTSELGWFCTARPYRQKGLTPEPTTSSTKQSAHSSCRTGRFDLPVLLQTAMAQSHSSHSPKGAAARPCPRRGDLNPPGAPSPASSADAHGFQLGKATAEPPQSQLQGMGAPKGFQRGRKMGCSRGGGIGAWAGRVKPVKEVYLEDFMTAISKGSMIQRRC